MVRLLREPIHGPHFMTWASEVIFTPAKYSLVIKNRGVNLLAFVMFLTF